MKRIALLITCIALANAPAGAQSFLKKLGERAKNAAENNIGNKVERGVNDILNGNVGKADKEAAGQSGNDAATSVTPVVPGTNQASEADGKWFCPECGTANTAKFCTECGTKKPDVAPEAKTETVKSDFERGSVVLFEDDFKDEQVGEFPSKWDIQGEGNAETAVVNGQKFLNYTTGYNTVEPLMENMKSYLPDVFTVEWDVFYSIQGQYGESDWEFIFDAGPGDRVGTVRFGYRPRDLSMTGSYSFRKPDDSIVSGRFEYDQLSTLLKPGRWNHFAMSFNKRALKFYINDVRVVNLPNVRAPERFKFWGNGDYKYRGFTNVLLCAGAKELYAQNTTHLSEAAQAVEKAIAETGKFVTNNILFDTGKATLKPESMPEIDKVAEYMKANPTARFEVQGHTDNQGSDKVNDPLSQQRAETVVWYRKRLLAKFDVHTSPALISEVLKRGLL